MPWPILEVIVQSGRMAEQMLDLDLIRVIGALVYMQLAHQIGGKVTMDRIFEGKLAFFCEHRCKHRGEQFAYAGNIIALLRKGWLTLCRAFRNVQMNAQRLAVYEEIGIVKLAIALNNASKLLLYSTHCFLSVHMRSPFCRMRAAAIISADVLSMTSMSLKAILKRDEDCADVIQEAIFKAFRAIHTLREPAYFQTWMFRILMNEYHQLVNRQKRVVVMADLPTKSATAAIKAQTGEIYQINLDPQLSSLDEGIRTKIKAAITETEKSLSYDDITKLNIDEASGEISTLGSYHLAIDAESGKVQMAIYYVPKSKVDQKIVQTAQQAAGALTGGKKMTFDSVQRFVGDGADRYLFTQREQSINVSIEATNKVQFVSWEAERTVYCSVEELKEKFAKPKYTAAEAIKMMNPIIKKIFGIDVTGYKVTVKANEYTFSKKGGPSVIALLNEKGKIYILSRVKES